MHCMSTDVQHGHLVIENDFRLACDPAEQFSILFHTYFCTRFQLFVRDASITRRGATTYTMMDETTAVSLAIVAAVILPLGTAISVYLDVKHREQLDKNKQAPEEATGNDADEEMGTADENDEQSVDSTSSPHPPPVVRFPTVSAATARFGSSSYNIFVVTTSLHAACSQVFNYWWYNTIKSSNTGDNGVDIISILASIGWLVAVVFLLLMSIIPAKGRGTIPHITCGMIFFQAAIAWMVWICMVTNRMGSSNIAVVIVQAILCSFAMLSATWAFVHVNRTMKRYTPGTMEWKDSLHKGALGQFSFGILYSIFMIVTAVSSGVAM